MNSAGHAQGCTISRTNSVGQAHACTAPLTNRSAGHAQGCTMPTISLANSMGHAYGCTRTRTDSAGHAHRCTTTHTNSAGHAQGYTISVINSAGGTRAHKYCWHCWIAVRTCTLLRDRRRGLLQVGDRSLVRRTALEVLAVPCRANGRFYVLRSTPLMAIGHLLNAGQEDGQCYHSLWNVSHIHTLHRRAASILQGGNP
jgi:hypothetical protein